MLEMLDPPQCYVHPAEGTLTTVAAVTVARSNPAEARAQVERLLLRELAEQIKHLVRFSVTEIDRDLWEVRGQMRVVWLPEEE